MAFECVLILAVHSNCHPYLRARANLAESVYLLVLCTLAIMQIVDDKHAKLDVCVVLLVMLACHTLVVTVCKATIFFRNRFHCACARSNRLARRRGYEELEGKESDQSQSTETQRRRCNQDPTPDSSEEG